MQGIRTVQRLSSAANLVGRVSVSGVRWNSSSNIAGGSMGRAWADKEHAAEAQYFNKKDAELLSNLANKLHNHTAPTVESIAKEREELAAIFAKHGMKPTDELLEEVVKFKFNHH